MASFDRLAARCVAAWFLVWVVSPSVAQSVTRSGPFVGDAVRLFDDVTATTGLNFRGLSFGVSAGDLDGDGWPDLFCSGHYVRNARLWRNQQNGTFTDESARLPMEVRGDLHGAQWADIDRDGTDELLIKAGAAFGLGAGEPNLLLVSSPSGPMLDVAGLVGLAEPGMRGRTPLALDFDADGWLDFYLSAPMRPDGTAGPGLFRQHPPLQFARHASGVPPVAGEFAMLGDLNSDGRLDLFVQSFFGHVFDIGRTGTLSDFSATLGLGAHGGVHDAFIADLTDDGRNDLLLVRKREVPEVVRSSPRTLEFRAISNGNHVGLRIRQRSPGGLILRTGPFSAIQPGVRLGSAGTMQSPAGPDVLMNPIDTRVHGVATFRTGIDSGVYAGWDAATSSWEVHSTSSGWANRMFLLASATIIDEVTPIGFSLGTSAEPAVLLTRVGGRWQDEAFRLGLEDLDHAVSVVAADFDNDMDLDLFVVTATETGNPPDLLLENRGNGRGFERRLQHGAEGSNRGIGESVIALDYDRDGAVDLCVVNGSGSDFTWRTREPIAFADDGLLQLFRNRGHPQHHWLAVELVGRFSNRDGIGARVQVTAGGKVQFREVTGGMHRYSQNWGIHFGLGPNPIATTVRVFWPSGRVSTLSQVAGDRTLQIVE